MFKNMKIGVRLGLGFRSPHEVLFGVEMRYTKPT